mgnify:CR=1 FL=1
MKIESNKLLAIVVVLAILSSAYVLTSHNPKPAEHEVHAYATTDNGTEVRYTYDVDARISGMYISE